MVTVLSVVAAQSGESLQNRMRQLSGSQVAAYHARLGHLLPWFAMLLLLASALSWWADRRGGRWVPVSVGVAIAAAIAAIIWTVLVGHSGATAVWHDIVNNTHAGG